jgi:hypothetical protein
MILRKITLNGIPKYGKCGLILKKTFISRNGLAYQKNLTFIQENGPKCVSVPSQDLEWSMDKLAKTSRSFSGVIMQLPDELRFAVSMFYLTLRALDTIGR